jgi:benzoylformate decarboxylase
MTAPQGRAARTAAHALIDTLRRWDIDQVFTCPGSTEAAFLDATVDRPDLTVVLATSELAAVSMADGYARATGRPAVAYLHANVGLTNGLSALYAAQLAHSPVVVLTGLKPTSIQGRRSFTTAHRIRDFAHQYVKYEWQSLSADAIPEDVDRAVRLALAGTPGPVWIGLPQDLLGEACDTGPRPGPRTTPDTAVPAPAGAVRQAAQALSEARRPLLVVGSSLARDGAIDHASALANRLGCPVMLEDFRDLERNAFPSADPHFAGIYHPASETVAASDVIVFLGTRCFTEFEPPAIADVPAAATVIHAHRDPAEIGYLQPVQFGLVGDEAATADALRDSLPATGQHGAARAAHRESARARYEEWAFGPGRASDPAAALRVPAAMAAIARWLPSDVTVIGDAITASDSLLRALLPAVGPDRLWLSSAGCLGWGIGAAVGVALAPTGRLPLVIIGDGGFQFGIAALATAAHEHAGAIFVVVNNGTYAAVGAALTRYGGRALATGRYPGVDISALHAAQAAEAFGVPARTVDTAADIADALDWARQQRGPALVEITTDPADFGPSSVPPRGTVREGNPR